MTLSDSKSYYLQSNVTFKPINVLVRNKKRLEKTSKRDLVLEMIKNCIDHGTSMRVRTITEPKPAVALSSGDIIVGDEVVGIVVENSVPRDFFENFSWPKFLKSFTTFAEEIESESNFHEGMTTYLLCPVRIDAGNYFIENRASGDGFYQYIAAASHDLDGNELVSAKFVPVWRVTVYDPEVASMFVNVLNDFSFVSTYRVEINGERYDSPHKGFRLDKMKTDYCYGEFYYKFKFVTDDAPESVRVFWTLKNGTAYHRINTDVFDNQGVSGTVVLTNIHQFANENRIELQNTIRSRVQGLINGVVKKNERQVIIKKMLGEYKMYKESITNYICAVLKLPRYMIVDSFFASGDRKRERLELATAFVNVLKDVIEKSRKARSREYPDVTVFVPPGSSEFTLSVEGFRECINALEVDLRGDEFFPDVMVGEVFEDGESEGRIYTGDFYQEEVMADPDEYDFYTLMGLEYEGRVVLGSDDVTYKYVVPDDLFLTFNPDECLAEKRTKHEGIDKLEQFDVNKSKDERELARKKAKEDEIERKHVIKYTEEKPSTTTESTGTLGTLGTCGSGSGLDSSPRIAWYYVGECNSCGHALKAPDYAYNDFKNGDVIAVICPQCEFQNDFGINVAIHNRTHVKPVKKELSVKGKVKYVGIVHYKRGEVGGEIPFLFNTEDDIDRASDGKYVTMKVTPQKFEAWAAALKIVTRAAGIVTPIYPAMYYELITAGPKKGKKRDVIAYHTDDGIVAYNTAYWPNGNQLAVANQILYVACHELAHEKHKRHGKKHQLLTEALFRKVNQKCEIDGTDMYPLNAVREMLKRKK